MFKSGVLKLLRALVSYQWAARVARKAAATDVVVAAANVVGGKRWRWWWVKRARQVRQVWQDYALPYGAQGRQGPCTDNPVHSLRATKP